MAVGPKDEAAMLKSVVRFDLFRRLEDLKKEKEKVSIDFTFILAKVNEVNENFPDVLDDIQKSYLENINANNKLSREIDTLTLEGDEHPFFSEATLYPLLGKIRARELLSFMSSVQKEL